MWLWTVDVLDVKTIWPEANDIPADTLTDLLNAATNICTAYAPAHPDPLVSVPIPQEWTYAVILQARHTWGQLGGGQQQEYGPDGLAIPVYPLVFAARDLLRVKSSPLKRLR